MQKTTLGNWSYLLQVSRLETEKFILCQRHLQTLQPAPSTHPPFARSRRQSSPGAGYGVTKTNEEIPPSARAVHGTSRSRRRRGSTGSGRDTAGRCWQLGIGSCCKGRAPTAADIDRALQSTKLVWRQEERNENRNQLQKNRQSSYLPQMKENWKTVTAFDSNKKKMVRSVAEGLRADFAEAHKEKAGLLDSALCRRTDVLWVKLTCNLQWNPLTLSSWTPPL